MGPESLLILLFVAKHLIFDWWLQSYWMASNKHRLLHPAGYIHAGINVIGTIVAIIVYAAFPYGFEHVHFWFGSYYLSNGVVLVLLLLGEFISHYIMDFTKMNVTRKMGWQCEKHQAFWAWTGFDQWFHLTYLVIMASILV